jgi:hypothetical protein
VNGIWRPLRSAREGDRRTGVPEYRPFSSPQGANDQRRDVSGACSYLFLAASAAGESWEPVGRLAALRANLVDRTSAINAPK